MFKTACRRSFILSLLLLLMQSLSLAAQQATAPTRTLIRAGHIIDVHTGNEAADQTIIVTGDSISAIAPTASTLKQSGDAEIDMRNMTVLPGLIDVHTHLTMDTNFDPYHELSTSVAKSALIGARNAKVTLEAGFTTVRNVGADGYADVDLRDAINEGLIEGPHMQVSGPALGITGGHCDDNLLPFEFHQTSDGVADGVEAVQHKVRENIKYGADVIKVCATGGVLSKGDDPQASQYTLEELKAIVADAHRLGRKVAAHAHGAQGILWATEAGIDSIEHGSYMNDEDIAAMKQHGNYFVPTAYLIDWMQQYGNLPPFYKQKMKDVSAVEKANAKKAIAAGVKVALGTDAAVYPHGLNAHELDVYVNQFGMTPLAALQTATLNAADLMSWTNHVGSIEAGKWADVIAVNGDPLKDIRILEHVQFVMKSGIVYKNESGALAK
ncbi:amidohydrolase family protein [Acidobacterium sp. S8]|uniref:metal-dependent hydrolase family protein n=1 Tax=Acidobacterium sp. S8 TaxID=1641854 RepID=UPI00131DACF5|nr:amidohydrolase family protein [Acidobacterium sp. S8]